jgi:hypothetical protein
MTRTRHAIPGPLLRSALTAVALAGVVAGVVLLHGATSASADDGISAELMQGPLVALPDGSSGHFNVPPSVGEPPLTITEPIAAAGSVFVVLDSGTDGGLTLPEATGASEAESLLSGLGVIEGTEMLGLPSSITVVDIVSSDLGG